MNGEARASSRGDRPPPQGIAETKLEELVVQALARQPSAGIAVAVVRDGGTPWFHARGVENTESGTPITEDTVFRIGSLTKTLTAVAVMQLCERGLVDLDGPVADYLRAFRLVPARAGLGPVTLRHLLTHTGGIGYWPRPSDLLRPRLGAGIEAVHPVPLGRLYRRGLPYEVQPGTRWMYSNHGFAALGQVVEDISGEPLDHYLRTNVFDPLGMGNSDLVPSERVSARLATGYVLTRNGLKAVPHREVPTPGGGAVYSTPRDMARYMAALLGGGMGTVLEPQTLASMFRPHFQADPRLPGMGLSFDLSEEGGHRIASKDGVVSGFLSAMALAPDDRIGVLVLSNTGGLDARGAPNPVADAILRHQLDLPPSQVRTDLPPHPEVWAELCGWYGREPGPMTNVFVRLLMGAGAEVRVRGGQLVLQPMSPIPAMRRGMRLWPDDPEDPYMFRIDMSITGIPALTVVFGPPADGRHPVDRLCFGQMAFRKRPDALNPRMLAAGALGGACTAAVVHAARGRRRGDRG